MSDGTYVDYHIDLGALINGGQLCYVEWSRGTCTFDAAVNVDTCIADKSVLGTYTEFVRYFGTEYSSVPINASDSRLSIITAEAKARLIECPIPERKLKRHITDRFTEQPYSVAAQLRFAPPEENRSLIDRARNILDNPSAHNHCSPRVARRHGDSGTDRRH